MRGNTSRRALAILLAVLSLLPANVGAQGTPDAQRMALVSEIGGVARAVAALEDGLLLAEGESLVRLDGAGREIGRAAPGRGAVQDLAARGGAVYALTETGLSVLDLDSLAERAFLPGGGQALAVTDRAIYVAAQRAGLRAALIGADGLPGGWQAIPSSDGAAVDIDADAAAAYLYVALGEGGIGIYALSDPAVPALVHRITDVGAIRAVDVDGARLFAASGHRLHVYDLSGPTQPVLADSYDPLHDARGLVLRGEWAYVADAAGGLKRYVFDSLTAVRFDRVVWQGEAYGVFDDGRYLYLAAGWDGVIALDAPDRDRLEARGRVVLPGLASAVVVDGAGGARRGLAALGAEGVAVIDWRDINAPRLGAVLNLGGAVRAVAVRDAVGFAAVEGVGLAILGLADVNAPTLLATVPMQGAPQSLALGGTLVYAAAGDGGLYVVETIRPAEAAIVGRLLPPRADQPFLHVALEGKRAYISTGDALLIADVDSGQTPQVLSTLSIPATAAAARAFIAYAVGPRSLTTVNGGSSNAPEILHTYRAIDSICAVLSGGEYVWLAGQGDGAQAAFLGLSGLGAAEAWTAGYGEGCSLATGQGGLAWLAAGSDGLIALRPGGASPVRPAALGGETIHVLADGRLLIGGGTGWGILDPAGQDGHWVRGEAPGRVAGLTGAGDSIFLALGEGGAVRYGPVDQGESFRLVAHWLPGAADGSARGVTAEGQFVYVAEDGPGAGGALRVLTAESLQTVTTVPLPGRAQAVAQQDGLAYVDYGRDGRGGLAVIDVRTPTAGLRAVGSAAFPATGLALTADGRIGYAVGGTALTVFDLSGWPEVRPLRVVRLSRSVSRLILDEAGRRLLGFAPGQSVLVLRLDDPTLPVPAAILETAAQDVAVYGDALYLAVGEGGLQAANLALLENLATTVRTLNGAPTAALWTDSGMLYAAGAASLRAYDLSDPFAPAQTATLSLERGDAAQALVGRATRRDGRWLYVGTAAGVWAAHHTPDGALLAVRVVDLDDLLAVGGGWLYARRDAHTLALASLLDLPQPQGAFAYPLPEMPRIAAVVVWEGRVLVGGPAGLAALEWDAVGSAALPVLLGQIDGLPGEPAAVWGMADTVWVAAGAGGVWRIDVRDPALPRLEAVISTAGEARGLVLSPAGDRLAVATGQCGVRLLDVTVNPPRETGYWQGAAAADVAAAGDLYAVAGENGPVLLREAPDVPAVLPPMPFDPTPPDRADGVNGPVTLSWLPQPDPCDGIAYEVRLSVGGASLERVAATTEPRLVLSDLPSGVAVRWQVVAVDRQGDAAEGPVWEFYTGAASPATVQPIWSGARLALPTPTFASPVAPGIAPAVVDVGLGWVLLVGGILLELALLALWWRWRRALRR